MKLQHFTALFALVAVLFCSCNNEKPYTITGTLDLPELFPYGDTLIALPSFEGTMVYLYDLENDLIDSTLIEDNNFYFEGKVKQSEAYFVQLVSQIGQTLIVVEPGDIEVYITPEITVNGTPSNDCMADIDAAVANLNNDTYEYLAYLTDSLRESGEEVTMDMQMQLAEEFSRSFFALLDSAYESNMDNCGGVYAALMRHQDCTTSDELEEAMSSYPTFIRNNELVQLNLRVMREYEKMNDVENMPGFDPQLIVPEGEGIPQQ